MVLFDDRRFPDRDDSQILEHLVHYCGKFEPLPTITVKVDAASAVVVRGHKYLVAARILKRPNIRAVVASPPSSREEVSEFLARNDVVRLNWNEIQAAESVKQTPKGWHVFFFERSLLPEEKRDFEERVAQLFCNAEGDTSVRVYFDDARKLAEFEAPTPVADQAWASQHLAVFESFSRERARIVSFQGRKFMSFGVE
jgi:hypothetical protein